MAETKITVRQQKFSGAKAYNTASSQSVLNGVWMAVNWQAEEFDTDSYWSIGNPSRLTVPADGYYMVVANVQCDTAIAGGTIRAIRLYINGASSNFTAQNRDNPSRYLMMGVSGILELSSSNYVEALVYQDSGAPSGNIGASDSNFSIVRLG